MRIAVIAHNLRVAGGLSVGHNITESLGRVGPEHHFFFIVPSGLGYEKCCAHAPNRKVFICENSGGVFSRFQFVARRLPFLLRDFNPDVIFALGNIGVQRPPCPQAILLQWAYLFYPSKHYGRISLTARLRVSCLKLVFKMQLKRTDLVFCQTRVMQERLKIKYNFNGISEVCPNALSVALADHKSDEMPSALLPHRERFKLFYLAKYYPYKNIEAIGEVFRHFRSELKDVVAVLTISPEQHPGAVRFLRWVKEHGLEHNIINVGPLKQSELSRYFMASDALLMPTLLESFSATYLEAMHFGLPILTSNLDFAHEICGDAALYFDPWNAESIRNRILDIKISSSLSDELSRKGKLRISNAYRSWDEITNDIIPLLARIAERN